jgi:NAD(P)-dependent dehydrogenase (short-subunit alcohol dehydrogenase family)
VKSKTVLITGCSSGIGAATVRTLSAAGYRVLASAPAESLLQDIPSEAHARYVLDVTSSESIEAVKAAIADEYGSLDVLINNAGYCQAGPIELLDAEQVERQFAVNVFGPIAMVKAFAPLLRKAGDARIVNLSSILGLFSMPVIGIYSASKHAVEGFSDALRMELAEQGIKVILIEPGWINTNLASVAASEANYSWKNAVDNPYHARMQRNEEQPKDASAVEGSADDVAKKILTAVASARPRARYKVTTVAHILPLLRRLLPTRWFDALISRMAW